MKTLIIGSTGKIGKFFLKKRKKNYFYTYNKSKIKNGIYLNLLKTDIKKIIESYKIKKIVLLSAISDPDLCEKNKKKSNSINFLKAKEIVDIAKLYDCYFIFFSTEFVFYGTKGQYSENSKKKPINIYGKQKHKAEEYIKKRLKKFAIFRIAKTYNHELNNDNIFSKLIIDLIKNKKIYAAYNQYFSPIYVYDIVKITEFFLSRQICGVFNIGGQRISRYNFCRRILSSISAKNKKFKNTKIYKINFNDLKFLANRPLNVSFNNKKLKKIINFKLTKISQVVTKLINENPKIFKRR